MSRHIYDRLLWPEGKKRALTLSYDDGVTQDIRLLEILNRYGIKSTFNLNPGLFGEKGTVSAGKKTVPHDKLSVQQLKQLYHGHEMAAHGQYHVALWGMDPARCMEEILTSRREVEQLTGNPETGYAYAFGADEASIVEAARQCGLAYARTIASTGNFRLPNDLLRWHPTCHHDDENLFRLAEQFLSEDLIFSPDGPARLFYLWGHSYEFEQNDNWDHIEAFISQVAHKDNVWYATNGEIARYLTAYRRLVFSADSRYVYNPSAIAVWLGSTFSDISTMVLTGETKVLPVPVSL